MQEVGGSIPPGSTSLRLLRKLRLGKPRRSPSGRSKRRLPRRSPKGEDGHAGNLLRKLRLGKPRRSPSGRSKRRLPRRSPKGEDGPLMKFVYILESEDSEHFYVGITDDVPARLAKHNAGEVLHTSKYRPWR